MIHQQVSKTSATVNNFSIIDLMTKLVRVCVHFEYYAVTIYDLNIM